MKFNRIRALTTKKEEFLSALQNSDIIEISETKDGIRKKIPQVTASPQENKEIKTQEQKTPVIL